MTTPNQSNFRGFIFRRWKPTTRAIALRQGLAVILAASAATAQTRPVATATNATVCTAEVDAFIKDTRQGRNGAMPSYMKIQADPKRVPLLLAAIEREPTRWVNLLQGSCFRLELAAARKLPPSNRAEVYARAIEYLTAAKAKVSKALQADPQNRQLKDSLGTLEVGLALAYGHPDQRGVRARRGRARVEYRAQLELRQPHLRYALAPRPHRPG